MSDRRDHVLADPEPSDGVVRRENLAVAAPLFTDGSKGLLEPAVAEGKRLVPGETRPVVFIFERTAQLTRLLTG